MSSAVVDGNPYAQSEERLSAATIRTSLPTLSAMRRLPDESTATLAAQATGDAPEPAAQDLRTTIDGPVGVIAPVRVPQNGPAPRNSGVVIGGTPFQSGTTGEVTMLAAVERLSAAR